jgi:hypothetical protein
LNICESDEISWNELYQMIYSKHMIVFIVKIKDSLINIEEMCVFVLSLLIIYIKHQQNCTIKEISFSENFKNN